MSVDAEPLAGGGAALRLAGARAETARGRGLGRGRVRALLVVDVLALWIAMAVTYLLAQQIGPPAVIAPGTALIGLVALATLAWPVVFAAYGLYERQTRAIAPSSLDDMASLFNALLAGSLMLLVIAQGPKKTTAGFVNSPLEAPRFLGFPLALVRPARPGCRTW